MSLLQNDHFTIGCTHNNKLLLVPRVIFFVVHVVRHVTVGFDGRYGLLNGHHRLRGATRYDGSQTLFRSFQRRRQRDFNASHLEIYF